MKLKRTPRVEFLIVRRGRRGLDELEPTKRELIGYWQLIKGLTLTVSS